MQAPSVLLTRAGPIVSSSIAATKPPWTVPCGLRKRLAGMEGDLDRARPRDPRAISSQPSVSAAGGAGRRLKMLSRHADRPQRHPDHRRGTNRSPARMLNASHRLDETAAQSAATTSPSTPSATSLDDGSASLRLRRTRRRRFDAPRVKASARAPRPRRSRGSRPALMSVVFSKVTPHSRPARTSATSSLKRRSEAIAPL